MWKKFIAIKVLIIKSFINNFVNNFKNPRNLELENGIVMASGNVKSAGRYFFQGIFDISPTTAVTR